VGQLVDQKKIDRALALLQRLPGFKVDASYQPGEKERSTQLLIKVVDSPLLAFGIAADNSGGRSTGKRKETATINLASPLKMGDLLNITALHTDGTDYARVAYSIPVGGSGLKVGANSSYMKYKFLASMEGSELTPLGRSVTYNVNANYPIILTKQANLSAEVNYDKKSFLNQMASTEPTATESDYKLDVASLMVSGSYIDGILAGGQTNASVNMIYGSVNLEGSPNITRDFEGANTQGRYKRLHLNFSRNQFITDSVSLNFDASGQLANRNLDSSEKFYLGGINGVRAYPTSEGSGSEGYLFKVELYKFLPYNFNASIFWDKGHVKQYHLSKLSPESTFKPVGPPNYSLEGYGASLAWSGPYQSSLKATYSHRVGQNPNPSTINNVNDQDGSLNMNVYWLTGSIAF
jgi:hemolysin activation/secretion protein